MDKEKNKELIHAFWKNFSAKKYVEALSMLDESATWWVAGKTKLSGKYNKQDFRVFYRAFPAKLQMESK